MPRPDGDGTSPTTKTIVEVSLSDDIDEMRLRAMHAKAMLQRGEDPTRWLAEQAGRPLPAATAVKAKEPDNWTWPQAVREFLEHVEKNKAPATYRDYRIVLNGPWMAGRWAEKRLPEITRREVMSLQNEIKRAGKGPQAHHVLRVVKSLMSWCTTQGDSGIEASVAATVKFEDIGEAAKQSVPTVDQIGRFPWELEKIRVLPQVRLACMLIELCSVRREAVASAKVSNFDDLGNGTGLWDLYPDDARLMVLPLPPLAWSVVQSLKVMAGGSEWLLPQTRLRREGDAGDGAISARLLSEANRRALPGLTPHDWRRALATTGVASGVLTEPESSALLGHAIDGESPVTRKHYGFLDGSHKTWRPARAWEQFVVTQIRKAAPVGAAWPSFLPLPDCYR